MATKTDKKNAIRQGIIDSAVIYSSDLAGKTFLYVYGNDFFEVSFPVDHFLHLTGVETELSAKNFDKYGKKINDCFLPMTLRVKDSSVEKSTDGDIVDFIFTKEASNGKYCNLIVKDESKNIPDSVRHLIDDSFYTILSE